ncbi:hypothetical protein ACN28S_65305 [Cystobacter fuscus]
MTIWTSPRALELCPRNDHGEQERARVGVGLEGDGHQGAKLRLLLSDLLAPGIHLVGGVPVVKERIAGDAGRRVLDPDPLPPNTYWLGVSTPAVGMELEDVVTVCMRYLLPGRFECPVPWDGGSPPGL